jgi:hypothetical protein
MLSLVKELIGWIRHSLQRACEDGSKEIIELLLEHGADMNATHPKTAQLRFKLLLPRVFLGLPISC